MEGQTRALETCFLEAILFEEKNSLMIKLVVSVTRYMTKI